MKLIFTLASLLYFSTSFSQWTRVQQLPSSEIASLYHTDSVLYAGGRNIIYFSKDKGLTWDSTSIIPQLILVTSIIVYKNELFAAAPNRGVFKSADGGATWQNISGIFPDGIYPDVSDFCEFRGDLYAATLGNSIYKLDPVNRDHWISFNNGLSGISEIATAIVGTSNTLIAGTNRNGLYDYLPANSTTWEERFLLPQVSVLEGAYDIVTAHDTLFWAGKTGRFYMSTDNGLTWNLFGNRLVSANSSLVNAKQALITSAHFSDGADFNTVFLYIKKDSLQDPFRHFSVVVDHFTWKIDILGDKLWDASNRGLFFMSLSDLPGISAADSVPPILLPIHFILTNAKCGDNKVLITWKTTQEQSSSRFDVEKSADGIHWTVIGSLPAAGSSSNERSYSFTDYTALKNSYYRIAEYDLEGRVQYSGIRRSSCNKKDMFSQWPNPFHDRVYINIVSGNLSQVMIKIFDNKGALIRVQKATVLQGNNQINVDMRSLVNGFYSFSIDWNNGQMKKGIQVLKQ